MLNISQNQIPITDVSNNSRCMSIRFSYIYDMWDYIRKHLCLYLSLQISHLDAITYTQPCKRLQHPSSSYPTSPPPLITSLQATSNQSLTVQICMMLTFPATPSLLSISRNFMDLIEPTLSTNLNMHAPLMASSR